MGNDSDQQHVIEDWFNGIYRKRGNRYLRPTRAYRVFLELLDAGPGDRLLDIACGLGRLLEAGRDYAVKMHGIDLSAVAVERAQVNVPSASIVRGNAEDLPYDDAFFDLLTCVGSLERVLDPSRALTEMHRVGKPNARYCLMVRNSESPGWRRRRALAPGENDGHAGADTLDNWSLLFRNSGYRIQNVLPDQYPLQRRQQWRSLFLNPVDFRKVIDGPLIDANEFVFLLEKAE